ncbi:MAG: transposase [Candidatus Neomarinimicrobiota bacterium]|jgi:putative transposase|nr:transposase [Candidatus Neomarinimicrobiota bacterium]MDD3966355.1 transposase [Candidatus Neomarinimicrobiota bacterium]
MRCSQDDFTTGRVFHVFNHAIDDLKLFYDDEDYNYFLQIFTDRINKIPAGIISYCLMPNHYHFLIRQDSDIKIYRLFNYTFISYARYFNKQHDRKGPIFRSPLQHTVVETKTYMIKLSKYIHMNPVYANLAEKPEDWPYSNYREWINARKSKLFLPDIRQNCFPNSQKYREYVEAFTYHYEE